MTVSTATSFNSYAGNGSTTSFAYAFKIFQDSNLVVTLVNDTTGVETTQTLTTDYTVTGAGSDSGGNVVFVTAPASGNTVVIRRVLPVTQETNYVPNDPFPAEAHEDALDKLTMLVQQEVASSELAVQFPEGDVGSGINNILPSVTGRSDKLLKFGLDGGVEVIAASDLSNAIIGANYSVDTFTGTGSTTVYTLSSEPGSKANTAIYIDGVYQAKANYSVSGSTLTFTTAPPLNSAIEIVIGDAIPAGAATTASAVSYTQGGTGAVTTNVQAKLRETVSVKDFGAVGDGTTDDAAAIQAAIDAVASSTEETYLHVPTGRYYIDSLIYLKTGCRLIGSGEFLAGDTIRDATDGLFLADDGEECWVEGISINGRTQRTQTCNLDPDGISGGQCRGTIGILCYGAPKVVIKNCTITECSKDGIYIGYDTTQQSACGEVLVTQNNVSECHRSGITLQGFRSVVCTHNIITDIYEGSIDLEVDDKTADNQGVNAIIAFNSLGITNQTNRANKNQQRIDVANQETGGDATSNVVLMGNTVYDYWGTVDTSRSDPLSMINIDTDNCRVTVQGNVCRTNAVTDSATGLININGGRYIQTGGNFVEYFGSSTSDSGSYGVLGGIVVTSSPNDYISIGNDRIAGNIDRAVWLRNCDSVKVEGAIIKTNTAALAGVYTDTCTNVIINDCIIDEAGRAVYVKDTTTLLLQDSILTPNAFNIEWNGTNTYAKAKNIITSKYSNLSAWATSTSYSAGDRVRRAAFVWRAVSSHTSSAGDRPGDSTGWTTYWTMEGFSEAANSTREMSNTGTEPSQYSEDLIIRTT
jgi:hypothetical protein